MSDIQFFQTMMGKKFFEGTMPDLVRELKKLNANLEKATRLRAQVEQARQLIVAVQSCPNCDTPRPCAECQDRIVSLAVLLDPDVAEVCAPAAAPKPAKTLTINVRGCARCGGDHTQITFSQLGRPIEPNLTHWAPCPVTSEPIVLTITTTSTPDAPKPDAEVTCGHQIRGAAGCTLPLHHTGDHRQGPRTWTSSPTPAAPDVKDVTDLPETDGDHDCARYFDEVKDLRVEVERLRTKTLQLSECIPGFKRTKGDWAGRATLTRGDPELPEVMTSLRVELDKVKAELKQEVDLHQSLNANLRKLGGHDGPDGLLTLIETTRERDLLKVDLARVTKERDQTIEALKEAQSQRQRIEAELNATTERVRVRCLSAVQSLRTPAQGGAAKEMAVLAIRALDLTVPKKQSDDPKKKEDKA